MIRIDQELNIEGCTVYRDEAQRTKFYVIANQPRFRIDDNGKPAFRFLKYRNPIDRGNGKVGGGFVIFDAEFVVPDDQRKRVQSALDDLVSSERLRGPAEIGELTYTRGTATLQLLDSGGALVTKIQSAGKPSLYGHNVCSFTAELSPEGATVCEQAFQGQGGVAQVIYDLHFQTKIPPIRGHVWFRAEKFYSYWQQIDKSDSHWWNGNSGEYKDTRREQFRASDSGGVEFDFDWTLPNADEDAKLKNKIRDWGWSQLEDAVKRLVLSDPAANTETGLPDGVNHVTRDFSTDKTASFDRYFRESDAVEWGIAPQGTLPNITSLDGVKWKDYAAEIDANDPFFKRVTVNVGVNADFEKFGIHSVDVWARYNNAAMHSFDAALVNQLDPHFTTADQRVRFSEYIANNSYKYQYGFKVSYKDESREFDAGTLESDASVLTIDVGDLGVLSVQVIAGGINWDQVASAEVVLTYADRSNNVDPIEKRYLLTKTDTQFHWLKVIMARRTQPYQYSVKYTLKDGKELTTDPTPASSNEVYIDDPFFTKAVHFRSLGDFTKDIDTIYIDATYSDPKNGFDQQTSIALTKANPFLDWTFPAYSGSSGTLSYSGKIKYQNGTTEDIPVTQPPSDTIYLASTADVLEVNVIPDLIDWNQVKLVTVNLHYADPKNGVDETKPLPIKAGVAPAPWRVKLTDKSLKSFTWSATYYLSDASNTHRTIGPVTTSDPNVVLQVPAN